MLFAQLLALALLVHEGLWLCQDGDTYLSDCFLPAFGLHLTRRGMRAAHLLLITLAAAVLAAPQRWELYPALLVALSVVIASYSLRLSNHLVIAWFMALLLCLDLLFQSPSRRGLEPTPFLYAGVRLVVILTYFIAFFHKLNADYFSPAVSCGAGLGRLHLENRGIRHSGLVRAYAIAGIYATLALEAAVPVLLLFPATLPVGLCLAVLLHLPFGLICQFHFSSLMYAGLAAFIPSTTWPRLGAAALALGWPVLLAGAALGALLGGRFGVSNRFRYRRPGFVLQMLFGVYTAAALAAGLLFQQLPISPRVMPGWGSLGAGQQAALAIVGLGFMLNGLGPYLGLKSEFSLAMFSNLRPEPWRHFLFPARWRPFDLARYVQVERIEGLPERGRHKGGWYADVVLTCLMKPELWLYSSPFFHEGLRLICRVAGPTPVVRVTYVEAGERHEVSDYAREMATRPRHYPRLNLFPYRLPRDPSTPHCA